MPLRLLFSPLRIAALLAWLWQAATSAAADDRPWAVGVTEVEQAAALELYAAGNRDFAESRYGDALAHYREAIRHWDHPAIRYNMAVCLFNLERPLEAHEQLEQSLVFGAAPLGEDAYQQGLVYRGLLAAKLARWTIRCAEPGARIMLDGKELFVGPGGTTAVLVPGPHQVVASKPGRITAFESVDLVAGHTADIALILGVPVAAPRVARRWPRWKPWAVVAGGSALLVAGTASYLVARRAFARYDDAIARACPHGCSAGMRDELRLDDTLASARRKQQLAFGLLAAGVIGASSGATLVMLNLPRVEIRHGAVAVAMTGSF